MKRFAAVLSSVLLVAATAFSSVSAASVLPEIPKSGTLTLEKYKPNTDPEKSKPVEGAEFTAYQVIDLADGTYKATANFEDVEGLQTLLENDEYIEGEGGLTYTSTAEFEKLIPTLQTVSDGKKDGVDGHVYQSTENKGVYTFGDMAIGVYLVVETKIPEGYTAASKSFLVSIPEWDQETGEWNYAVTAYPKNAPLTLDKSIKDGEDKVSEATKAVGDQVPYVVEAILPYYGGASALTAEQIAGVEYCFKDTMSKGLTFNNDLVVKVDGIADPLTAGTKTVNDSTGEITWSDGADYALNYTTDAEGVTTITVDFNWASLNASQSKQITLEYSATLNKDAVVGPDGNTNKVELTYTNDPSTGSKIPTPPTDETKVYTYGMDLTKTFNNGNADGTKIDASGVEFSLSMGNEKLWFITSEAGKYIAYDKKMTDDPDTEADESTAPAEGVKVTIGGTEYTITQKLHPTSTGSLAVDGLNVGTYKLVEENSIEGFSKLASDVIIVVSEKKENEKITGEVVAVVGDKTLSVAETNLGKFLFTVNNVSKQFDLPLTGGAGLFAFTIGGGIIMAIAIIIFAQLRKKKTVTGK